MTHELKLQQPFFNHVFYNQKEFEVRKDDRDFKVGDKLKLIEFPFIVRQRFVIKEIKYILKGGQFGIEKGYVVLGLKEVSLFPVITVPIEFIAKVEKIASMKKNYS